MPRTSGHQPRCWLALLTVAVLLAGCASPAPTASPALVATSSPTATPPSVTEDGFTPVPSPTPAPTR